MRTTLNIDDDVAAEIVERARVEGRSMSRVANELIRTGMRMARELERPARYDPPTFDTGQPLVDVSDVADALEVLDVGG